MVAVTVGDEPRGIDDIGQATEFTLARQVALPGAVAACTEAALDTRPALAIRGEQLNDAAGRIAIDRRQRAAHDLDALGAVEVESGRLPLPVRHRRRNAVSNQADATHTKGSAGTETARGNLQVLSVVLAILNNDPRHPSQRIRGIDPGLRGPDCRRIDDIDRRRQIKSILLDPAAGDHQRVETDDFLGHCRYGKSQGHAGGERGHNGWGGEHNFGMIDANV